MTRSTQSYPLLFICIACIAIQLVTIRVSHALESIGVLSTEIGNVTVQGTLANSSSSSSVTNSVEVGQPVVTDAAVVLERGS